MTEFANWSGGLRFTPADRVSPASEGELSELLRQAAADGRTVRAVGSGHSSAPLVRTDGLLVSLDHFDGLISHDADARRATLGSGTPIHRAGQELLKVGLAMENTGDIDRQTLAGGFATGTHGTGRTLGNLSTQLAGVRLVLASGEVLELGEDDGDLLRAARVSLGALGIATALTLRLVPAFRVHRSERCAPWREVRDRLDELAAENRNFDFYWYPRKDEVKLRRINEITDDRPDHEVRRGSERDMVGWSADVLPRVRELRFHEMEYALPAEAGPACFAEVRERVRARHLRHVAWRVLYRTIAADDAYFSTAHGRDTVTISLHQNQDLPYLDYFADLEPIFQAHGGRPHWAKLFTLKGEALLSRYPMAGRWLAARRRLDPGGLFLTPYLRDLLGVAR
ncbi:FAD-binding protein [Nonomuraea sp. NN258]|uniref:D-arabinono-1,4-lactone oxidase n=1 Tax=Nonomuraea antri TaxID=2730852 RepID=UPI001569120A|nr:D-arabinono-1,4-lactone oxidase [Nonomuraea antri]NRQ33129.1 FAD-binding protein [Nonomuraea antri]